jgi:hypothetical protein
MCDFKKSFLFHLPSLRFGHGHSNCLWIPYSNSNAVSSFDQLAHTTAQLWLQTYPCDTLNLSARTAVISVDFFFTQFKLCSSDTSYRLHTHMCAHVQTATYMCNSRSPCYSPPQYFETEWTPSRGAVTLDTHKTWNIYNKKFQKCCSCNDYL